MALELPAAMERTHMTAVAVTPQDLVKQHAELVAERAKPGLTSGVAASLSRRIGQAELEMELQGLTYEPYVPASQSASSLADLTDAAVKAGWDQAVAERKAATKPGIKASGTLKVKRYEAEMTKRGMEFAPATFSPSGASAAMNDEQLATRIHKVRQLLASPKIRPRIQKIASAELASLETLASERGVPVSGVRSADPVPDPTKTGGQMLDDATDELADRMAASALDSSKPDTATRKRSGRKS